MRTAGLDSSQGPTGNISSRKSNRSAVAIIHDKQRYGEGAGAFGAGQPGGPHRLLRWHHRGKRFLRPAGAPEEENIDFVYYGGYYPEMGQMLRRARSVGLKNRVYGAGRGRQHLAVQYRQAPRRKAYLVTMPKRYDRDPANSAIVNALKAEKKNRADRTSESPMPPFSRWRRRWTEPAASSRWI